MQKNVPRKVVTSQTAHSATPESIKIIEDITSSRIEQTATEVTTFINERNRSMENFFPKDRQIVNKNYSPMIDCRDIHAMKRTTGFSFSSNQVIPRTQETLHFAHGLKGSKWRDEDRLGKSQMFPGFSQSQESFYRNRTDSAKRRMSQNLLKKVYKEPPKEYNPDSLFTRLQKKSKGAQHGFETPPPSWRCQSVEVIDHDISRFDDFNTVDGIEQGQESQRAWQSMSRTRSVMKQAGFNTTTKVGS